jgi:hypothetical protein
MIKKATVKQTKPVVPPGVNIIQLPQPLTMNMVSVKKPKVKPKLDFDYCLKQLQSNLKEADQIHEDYIDNQKKILKGLIQLLDNKQVAPYLLNKFKNSRFKSYKMAMRTFTNLIDGYFDGSVDMSGLISYQDIIPSTAAEHWYEEFNDFRYEFIRGIRNDNREASFYKCVEILAEAETNPYSDESGMDYIKWLDENIKINKKYVIDLMELVWPDKGGTLKLLFGN